MKTLNNELSQVKKSLSRKDILRYISNKNKSERKSFGRMQTYLKKDYEKFLASKSDNADIVLVDLGSYNRRFTKNTINVDIFQEGNTDLIWDITKKLPFKTNSVDFVVCSAVLEHVNEPIKVVKEIQRILRPGGFVWADVPFMQPYHESPSDFQRYTLIGFQYLFRNFDIKNSGSIDGPGLGLHWLLKEYADVIKWEKIPLSPYPSLKKMFSAAELKALKKDLAKMDKYLSKIDPERMPFSFHITASAVYVCAKKPVRQKNLAKITSRTDPHRVIRKFKSN